MQQSTIAPDDRVAAESGIAALERVPEQLAPTAFADGRLGARGRRIVDRQAITILCLGPHQSCVGGQHQRGDARPGTPRHGADGHTNIGPRFQGRSEGRLQRLSDAGGIGIGCLHREVRAIEAPRHQGNAPCSSGAQAQGERLQQGISGGMAGIAVAAGKIVHSQQQQGSRAGRVLAGQHRTQLCQKVAAVGQAGERIGLRLLAQCFQLSALLAQHGLQPLHHGIHRTAELAQLGNARLGHGHEAPFDDGARLVDRCLQRRADPPEHQRTERTCQQPDQDQPAGRPQAALPKIVERKTRRAHHLEGAQRPPAVGDLRDTGKRLDRHQPPEPGRHLCRLGCAKAFNEHLPFRSPQADALIEAGVELCADGEFGQREIAVLLRQRECQRLGVVAVLQAQLRF
ncbi:MULTISPECIES: hypothetical protein [unclassified Methylibium]|uniref:hypothetical protein n=1 Tax=Methylibium sp. T29 TaxID=1430884 RepID=UPI0003F3D308|nr:MULTISPECIES: hypothetical protein [unclassified Methylibium]EWS56708.1 hypothetical protein X551_00445 [Methylibium sp. T29]EWS61868.1 hypothetical protein Y694_00380 [Methylibium sp. T29-B]